MYLPKLSIITVVYNRVNTIEQLISSVLNQTYENIEFIIVDGASTDGTVDIIKKYEGKISKWISEPDTGIYNAMNKGIDMATGDYVEIIGSDDALIGEDVISNIIPYFESKPDILSANEYILYPDVNRQQAYLNNDARDPKNYKGGMVGHAAMFVKRSLLRKYKFDESYRIAADYKFFLQCYYDNDVKIKYIDDFIAFFETDAGGASANVLAAQQEDERIYTELNLPFDDEKRIKSNRSNILSIIVFIAEFFHIKKLLGDIYRKYFLSKKHHCNNKICR